MGRPVKGPYDKPAYYRPRTKLSPRVELGLHMYGSGVVPTLRDAAAYVGLAPLTLVQASNTELGRKVVNSALEIIKDKSLSASELIQKLSRRMVEVEAVLAESANAEALRLKAAQDLLDRNPETSKTQRMQLESLTLDGKDAARIAEAMVEAAKLRERHSAAAEGDYVKVNTDVTVQAQITHAPSSDSTLLIEEGEAHDPQR